MLLLQRKNLYDYLIQHFTLFSVKIDIFLNAKMMFLQKRLILLFVLQKLGLK